MLTARPVTQAAVVAPLVGDPVPVVVVKLEVLREFMGTQCVGEITVALPSCWLQKAAGHEGSEYFNEKVARGKDARATSVAKRQ